MWLAHTTLERSYLINFGNITSPTSVFMVEKVEFAEPPVTPPILAEASKTLIALHICWSEAAPPCGRTAAVRKVSIGALSSNTPGILKQCRTLLERERERLTQPVRWTTQLFCRYNHKVQKIVPWSTFYIISIIKGGCAAARVVGGSAGTGEGKQGWSIPFNLGWRHAVFSLFVYGKF